MVNNTKCHVVDNNGNKCDKAPFLNKAGLICRGCIPNHWQGDFVEIEQSSLVRLRNVKHVRGIADLSRHQGELQQMKAILSEKNIDVKEGDVENFLLNLLQTPHWDVDFQLCKPRKRGFLPNILFLREKQLSLVDTVVALMAMEVCHRKQKENGKKSKKKALESGLDNQYCSTCLPQMDKGKGKKIFPWWSKIQHDKELSFECTSCMIESLKQLSKTDPFLSFNQDFGDGKGFFLYQNQLYDPNSDDVFCSEQILCYDLNRPLARKSPVFSLLAAGAVVPSINDTEEVQAFLGKVNQLTMDHDQHLLTKAKTRAEERQSLDTEQAEALVELGNIPSLTQDAIDQNVKQLDSLINSVLSLTDADQPSLAMCNACSMKANMINGELSTSRADGEHLRKIKSKDVALLLDVNGGIPLEGTHFTIISEVGKLDRTRKGNKFQVLVHDVSDSVDHESVRMMEKAGIELIQSKASQNRSRIISTEHPSRYFPGSKSSRFFLGQTTCVIIYDWLRLIQEGNLFLNASSPPFFKQQVMQVSPVLVDPKFWKCHGDNLTLAQRLAKRTLNGSLPTPAPAVQQQMIVAMPSMKESRKRLEERSVNVREEVRDRGDKKPKSVPEESLGKTRLVVSGTVGNRVVLKSKLEANESWLGLELRDDFAKNIGERAHRYIFVEGKGKGASNGKVITARDNHITTWSPEKLAKFLAKL